MRALVAASACQGGIDRFNTDCLIAFAQGLVSAYVVNAIGPISPF
jgi:hypothetical protein